MSEHAFQVAVAHQLILTLDPARTWWSAIDHGAGKMSKRAAGMMKARGVQRGLPDFIVMWRASETESELIGIELKTGTGRVSAPQIAVSEAWLDIGFTIFVARSLEEVQDILEQCRIPMKNHLTFFGGDNHDRAVRSIAARDSRSLRRRKPKNSVSLVQRRSA